MSLVETTTGPLSRFTISSLLEGCAGLRPDQCAISDSSGVTLSFAEWHAASQRMAGAMTSLGLGPGDCALLLATPRASTLIGLVAALRAGLDVALVPAHLTGAELRGYAARLRAVAAFAGQTYDGLQTIDAMMEVAASCETLRLIGSLEGEADGAVDLASFAAEGHWIEPQGSSAARVVTYVPGGALRHLQRTLVASTLDAVSRLRIGAGQTLITTIAPSSFAGLVSGPLMALLSGATLTLHGPFSAAGLMEEIAAAGVPHLIIPRVLGGAVSDARLPQAGRLASLSLLHRAQRVDESSLPLEHCNVPVFDLTAFGETCLVAEARDLEGSALPPAMTPHMIELDGRNILALRRGTGSGALRFEGEAVTFL
jgi:hypothetical protein